MTRPWIGTPDGQGRAVALVHGAGGSHVLWAQVLRRLESRGIPALALDLPGHGGNGDPVPVTLDGFARAAEEIVSRAGASRYVLAGHSLGGAVALTLAVRHAPGLRGVGAVSTGARLVVDRRILEGALHAFECTVENLSRYAFAKGVAQEMIALVATTMASVDPRTLYADFAACAAYEVGAEQLGKIGVPVEVLCGAADVLTPVALSEELAAKIPGARLTLLDGVGHMPLLEDPDGVAQSLERLWERAF